MRILLIAVLALLLALTALAPIANNDIWLHLKTGSLILDRGAVPHADEYTFTRAGAPWIAHEWLAQAVFALVYRAGGTAALSLFYAAMIGAIVCLVYGGAFGSAAGVVGTERLTARAIAAAVTAWTVLLMMSFLSIRPHLFTFLFAAAYPRLLDRAIAPGPPRRRAIAVLIVLQVAWANLHGGFVIGILLAAIHSLDAALRSRRFARAAALPATLAAASLLNPYGWRIYELVAGFGDPFIRQVILEWRSPFDPDLAASALFWALLAWFAAAVTAASWEARSGRAVPAATILLLGLLSATSRRHISLMAIVTAPIIGRGAAALLARVRLPRRRAAAAAWGAVGCVAALAGGITLGAVRQGSLSARPGAIARNIPVEAVEVMRSEGMQGRVFTTLGLASYVTWRGWPDMLTSADSRLEVLGGEFLRTALAATRGRDRFEAFAALWPFDYALLPWRLASVQGAIDALASDPGWTLVYFDDIAAIYARRSSAGEAPTRRRGYETIDPARFMAGRGLPAGTDLARAEAEARRAAEDPPALPLRPAVNGVARMMLGAALMRDGRPAEAAAALRDAIGADPRLAPAYGMLAACLKASGDIEGSRAVLRSLESLSPGSVPADLR